MKTLKVEHFGPIEEAQVELGDITILVGPQATGKSIFLQLLHLVQDKKYIVTTLKKYGFVIKESSDLLAHYLGKEMVTARQETSKIEDHKKEIDIDALARTRTGNGQAPSSLYIPAQRVITMEDGWPRPFMNLISYPFVVRDFSEKLRVLLESGLGKGKALFPQEGKFKKAISDNIQLNIFRGSTVKLEQQDRKRMVLAVGSQGNTNLPIALWSAGQREFLPLLVGLFYLIPSTRTSTKDRIKTVIIEEIEMGLHPNAISAVMLAILELVHRGYKVVISTHSVHVLEIVWAIEQIKKSKTADGNKKRAFLKKLFKVESSRQDLLKMAGECLKKTYKVFYFAPGESGLSSSRDISGLDSFDGSQGDDGWGGLSEFSSQIVDLVSGLE